MKAQLFDFASTLFATAVVAAALLLIYLGLDALAVFLEPYGVPRFVTVLCSIGAYVLVRKAGKA